MMSRCLGGGVGNLKLAVSVSFGASALCKWNAQSCLDSAASSCWLDHGDLVVMDGQCQDEFLHCTDPGLEQERINITLRWIKRHVASCLFFGQGWRAVCQRVRRVHPFLLRSLWRKTLLGYAGVPIAGHALWSEVGGGIIFVAFWEFAGCPFKVLAGKMIVTMGVVCRDESSNIYSLMLPWKLAFVRFPSLHGCYWASGALRGKLQATTR